MLISKNGKPSLEIITLVHLVKVFLFKMNIRITNCRCPNLSTPYHTILFWTNVVQYTGAEKNPEYQFCSVHNTRRLVKYLQQKGPGNWSCTEQNQCLLKGAGIGHRPAGETCMGVCSIHNRRRLWPSKLQFNAEKNKWECRPDDPCRDREKA